MKVKTSLKIGQWDYANAAQQAFQGVGQQAADLWQKIFSTLTNPKFWTWPF